MTAKFVDVHPAYKEKIWGKGEGKDFVTDGYVFKGKKPFIKAFEGLKESMKKGLQDDIDTVKFKVLDDRKNGAGIEIEVEVLSGKERGIAVLKLYGPNSKKGNTVTVSKSKDSDHKFVIMLAEKVIKPLMNNFLSEEEQPEDPIGSETESPNIEQFECSSCDKMCASSAGLKTHITKIHVNQRRTNQIPTIKRKVREEVHNVVESLLQEVIEISKEEITLDESVTVKPVKSEEKKYINFCEYCDYKVEACRQYTSLQLLLKHKEVCVSKSIKKKASCPQCDVKFVNIQQMKRHTRDVHGVVSVSTSPPLKKKRRKSNGEVTNKDIEMQSEVDEDKLEDLSLKLEDMDIDNDDQDKKTVIHEERSKLMDKKIKAKKERIQQEEKELKEKKKAFMLKKKMEKEKLLEQAKIIRKQVKQKKKDTKKISQKKNKTVEKDAVFLVPNIRNIPVNCKHLVDKGDVLYVVPGDGCCGPNCGAAFLFKDEVFGPKLRKSMNIFFTEHWNERYQYLTQCSPGHPFVRKVKGVEKSFTDPKELIKYLKTSEDAMYMWSDSEDFAVLADMYLDKTKMVDAPERVENVNDIIEEDPNVL